MDDRIFLPSGYLNMSYIYDNTETYTFITGGRGIGKTFGRLLTVIQRNIPFLFMRRTQTQIDMLKNDDMNPFKALEYEYGDQYRFIMRKINKNITGVYRTEFNEEKQLVEPVGRPIGYMIRLSTVANLRGWNAENVRCLIYDEFIGEKHERPIPEERHAFLNAIETIRRNRELKGLEPMKVIALSNSNIMANPIFIELQLVMVCEKMLKNGQQIKHFPNRALSMILLEVTPIGELKAQTSLYKLAGPNSDFTRMALENEFTKEEMLDIASRNLKEYRPITTVGEISIYKHKSRKMWYVCGHQSGTVPSYETSPMELKRFTRDHYSIWLAYLNRRIEFESYLYKALLEKYFNIW